jgi:DNA-binding transcriptional LysR family regulator
MDKLKAISSFVEAATSLSFTAAARRLGVPRGKVSRDISDLEQHLGIRLFNRTTREVSLTDGGARYLQTCQQVLGVMRTDEARLMDVNTQNEGMLRVLSVRSFGERHLAQAAAAFRVANPAIRINLELAPGTKTPLQLHEAGFDLGVCIAPVRSASAVVRKIANFSWILCASPVFAAGLGGGLRLEDLSSCPAVINPRSTQNAIFNFARGSRTYSAQLSVEIAITNYWAIRDVLLTGFGISVLPSFCVREDIAAGRLVRLLPEYSLGEDQVSAVYPHFQHVPAKAKRFADFLRRRFDRTLDI